MQTIFFFLLAFFSFEIDFSSNIYHLSSIPLDSSPYLIFAHRAENCPFCVNLGPTWNLVAEMGEGFATFSELNCNEFTEICQKLNVSSVPSIFFLKDGKSTFYDGYKVPRSIVNWVSKFIDDTAINVSINNYTKFFSTKNAILFTEKLEIPKIWTAVEKKLNNSDVRFFVSNDRKLHSQLGLSEFPGIYAGNLQNQFFKFESRKSVILIVDFLNSTFMKIDQEL
ncbi:hypothetical protein TRFO_36699 [Tritrichomonas foetus]|uniref:Thioredoxin domain-containing protein n=1 Tax=Tritrichomonas foetus TaxID=1144522 RepID=A0A1J4JDJ1_9EUKA|nr:hypothetical protein TRFO_36699 [Tritrichomonas foetus]|eukprot:OHS97168.1 hypothetical protein TRFO_36699 [Tritrichomonas foetus]